MKKEKSCGAIIYKKENNKLKVLLIKQKAGHWSFPKGHVENEETEEETAYREIFEETGLKVNIDSNFRYVMTYSPKDNVVKDVVLFLATVISGQETPQPEEVETIMWVDIKDAYNILTYNDTKDILKKVEIYLKNIK
jgi:8-oxo-dGTP pyrophosphatase MutT (NUDIX family)